MPLSRPARPRRAVRLAAAPAARSVHLRALAGTRRLAFPGEPDRTCDTVAFLRDQGQHGVPWAVVLEFQSEPDPLMFGRLLRYLGALWAEVKPSAERGDRFEVAALVVHLTGVGRSGRDCHWSEAQLRTLLLSPDRNLKEQDAAAVLDQIAAAEVTQAVLGWIPLMQGGGEPAIIQRWVEVASAEPDVARRADHGSLVTIFAEAAGCGPTWRKALEGWNVIQSKQVLEWQAMAVGDMVVALLEERFGAIPENLAAAIKATHEMSVVQRWAKLTVRAPSLDEFRRDAGL